MKNGFLRVTGDGRAMRDDCLHICLPKVQSIFDKKRQRHAFQVRHLQLFIPVNPFLVFRQTEAEIRVVVVCAAVVFEKTTCVEKDISPNRENRGERRVDP